MILIIIRHTVDCLRFNMDEIMKATDHLSKKNEIGKGGFGSVFMATNLRCSGTTAAIKVLTKVCTNRCMYVIFMNSNLSGGRRSSFS